MGRRPTPRKPFFRERLDRKNLPANYFCLNLFTMVTTATISITPVGPSPTGLFNFQFSIRIICIACARTAARARRSARL